jgi:outer membrane immunogenic protein
MKGPFSMLVALSAFCGSANAADLPFHTPAPPPYFSAPVPTWSGFYIGANVGQGCSVLYTVSWLGDSQSGGCVNL